MRKACTLLWLALYPICAVAGDFVVEENRGQADPDLLFIGRDGAFRMGFSNTGILWYTGATQPLALSFEGQTETSRWEPLDPLPSSSSYFIGNNPNSWIRNVPHSRRLIRRGIYPGIDLIFYGSGDRIAGQSDRF